MASSLVLRAAVAGAVTVAGLVLGVASIVSHRAQAATPAAAAEGGAAALRRLSGTWRSTGPERWGEAWGWREFTFDRGRWSLRFTLALDPQAQAKVFEFRTGGSYQVLRPSAAVPGAWDALFNEEAKFVTLHALDAGLVQAFGLAGCALVAGVEKDISRAGCANWKPVAQCGEDHDLLALDADGGLRFGVRPDDNDMCTADKRPTALLPAVRRAG
jgi:hypothetical protein